MSYALDLSGAWAKLDRAKIHVNALRQAIEGQGLQKAVSARSPHTHALAIPLRRQFEPEQKAIVWRVERVVQIGDDWPLLVGDAAHNMRCALDHLAWQLAIRHSRGITPTDRKIIKEIQFPVVLNKPDWPSHIHRKHMASADADKLEKFQPFNLGPISRAKGALHPLEGLAGFNGLDNVDKHRTISVTSVALDQAAITMSDLPFIDCAPIGEIGEFNMTYSMSRQPPQVGDEILRVYVVQTGPNPDMDFEPGLACYVAIRETWDVLDALDTFTERVAAILSEFGAR